MSDSNELFIWNEMKILNNNLNLILTYLKYNILSDMSKRVK